MSCMATAVLIALSAAGPSRAPDLQVEAATAAGAGLPELADAVARALVASGARVVVLRRPTGGACESCAQITITEMSPGTFQVQAIQDRQVSSTTLHLPAGSSVFDQARAIAIQARSLTHWRAGKETRGKEESRRQSLGKPQAKAELPQPAAAVATLGQPPSSPQERTLAPVPVPAPAPARPAAPEAERPPEPPLLAPAKDAEGAERKVSSKIYAKSASPSETRTAEPQRSELVAPPAVDIARSAPASQEPLWPWIPTVVGAGAAVGAGLCAWVARSRYNSLADKTQSYGSAKELKLEGEDWQLASFILSGVAVAGLGTGLVGFVTRSSHNSSVTAVASPLPGGGMLSISGDWP
jgi:hypothetical protein